MASGPLSVRIEFDPQDKFYHKVMGYEHLISNSNFYAVAQIQRGLASIILGALENAIAISGIPTQYADHLRIGFNSVIIPEIDVSTTGSILQASVPDIVSLGTWQDLITGFHYHALAGNPATDGRKFSKTVVNRIELPYLGQELYNHSEERQPRRQAFWEHILAGTVYTVEVVRRNRGKGGGTNSYNFTVPTAGLKDETFNARVANWTTFNRYPEWLLLEYGDDGPPAIQATHIRAMIQIETLSFMEEAWRTQFDTLVDQWNNSYETRSYVQEEQEWNRFYSHHMDDVIDRHDYGYDFRGKGSKIRNLKTGRFA